MIDKDLEVGALWEQTSPRGVTYATGTINGVKVVMFRSKSDNAKAPTYRIYKSVPREAGRAFRGER